MYFDPINTKLAVNIEINAIIGKLQNLLQK